MDGNKAQEGIFRPSCVRRPNFRSLVFPFFDLPFEYLAVAGVHEDLMELAVVACDLGLEDDEAALVLQLDLPRLDGYRAQGGLLDSSPVYLDEWPKVPGLSGRRRVRSG